MFEMIEICATVTTTRESTSDVSDSANLQPQPRDLEDWALWIDRYNRLTPGKSCYVMFKHRRSWKWLTVFQYISTHNTKMTVFQDISTPSKGWCTLFTRWHRIKKDGEGKSACSTCWACFLDHWIGWNLEGCTTTISRWYSIVGVIFWILFRAHNQLAITLLLYIYVYILEYCFRFSMKSPTSNKIDVGGVQLKYPQVSANLETKLICHSTCVTTQNPRPLFCLHTSNSKALLTISRVDWPAYVSRWVQLWDETPE